MSDAGSAEQWVRELWRVALTSPPLVSSALEKFAQRPVTLHGWQMATWRMTDRSLPAHVCSTRAGASVRRHDPP